MVRPIYPLKGNTMYNTVLALDLSKTITDAVSAVEGASRKMQSSIDALAAGGMRSTDFVSPKSKGKVSTSSPEKIEAINAAIVAGFSARVQKLLAAPTKALSETDKADKRYWQQQIGARRADFEKGLAKREGVADNRAPQQPKSPEDKIRAMIESIEKVVQGAEGLTFDAADFLKDLRALNRKIK
jgi:fructose-1,6-bisphosphatase